MPRSRCVRSRLPPTAVDEFELIRRHFVRDSAAGDVVLGIGDDGAVLRPPPGKELVAVIDTLVETVHFTQGFDAADLGFRAVAVNLSDIAAMGAEPRWMTLALTLSRADDDWLAGFAQGLRDAADPYAARLVGGDTTRGETIVVTVHVTGFVDAGSAILRSGARVGDTVYVSGTIGDAAAGLTLLQDAAAGVGPASGFRPSRGGETAAYLVSRFRRPTARIRLGRALAGVASAAIDLSDGFHGDLGKLLEASGVGAAIDIGRLPLSPALIDGFGIEQARRFALSGGDDYELCFTAPEMSDTEIAGVPVTAVGRITGTPGIVLTENGKTVPYEDRGYVHFR